MLKSEWKELPDWKNPEDYAFMEGAKPAVWAWEFLRRIDQYRTDYDHYAKVMENAKTTAGKYWKDSKWVKHYNPPKLSESETYGQWIKRTAYADGPDPDIFSIYEFFPKKWGLKKMAPYNQQFGEQVNFRKEHYPYPRLICDDADFFSITAKKKTGKDDYGPDVIPVQPDKAVVAFDLFAPRGPQIEKVKLILDQHYRKMRKEENIKRSTVPKQLTPHLTRHLQVLDAIRTQPYISPQDIATELGYTAGSEDAENYDNDVEAYDKSLSKKTPSQQGSRWRTQAEATRDAYLNFLIKPGTSKKA